MNTFGSLIELEEKALSENEDAYRFTGYAAVFGNRDLGDDIIVKGAFEDSLAKHGMPLLLFNHKMDELPIGVIDEASEDRKGLLVVGELPKDDPVARRVGIALKARKSGNRALKGMSIGYRTQESHKDKAGARVLTKLRLYEASFVNRPMNPLAGVETLKSDRLGIGDWKDYTDREREASLKARGLSDDLAKRFVRLEREAQGTKGRRDAGDGGLSDAMRELANLKTQLTQLART